METMGDAIKRMTEENLGVLIRLGSIKLEPKVRAQVICALNIKLAEDIKCIINSSPPFNTGGVVGPGPKNVFNVKCNPCDIEDTVRKQMEKILCE